MKEFTEAQQEQRRRIITMFGITAKELAQAYARLAWATSLAAGRLKELGVAIEKSDKKKKSKP